MTSAGALAEGEAEGEKEVSGRTMKPEADLGVVKAAFRDLRVGRVHIFFFLCFLVVDFLFDFSAFLFFFWLRLGLNWPEYDLI